MGNSYLIYFKLITNDVDRRSFDSHCDDISVFGFDIKEDREIKVKIQAKPLYTNCTKEKISNACVRYVTYKIINILHIYLFLGFPFYWSNFWFMPSSKF